ncbi:hypothetical protein GVN21_20250 [Caulobacter sp. SLTY]|nr:hypothetical protein [Caulobacter sp. SLTY]
MQREAAVWDVVTLEVGGAGWTLRPGRSIRRREMRNEKLLVEQGFYQACAERLGAETHYRPFPYSRRTRWNAREPGNGRYPGFGLIRLFGETVHIQLRRPAARAASAISWR